MSEPLCIGLNFRVALGGWLGGFYYLVNLARAVATLDAAERPDLRAFVPVDDPRLPRAELNGVTPVSEYPEGDPRRALPVRVRNRLRWLVARATGATWGVEAALAKAPVDLLFPAWGVAPAADVVEVPWIYDLQHVQLPENFSQRELEKRDAVFRDMVGRARLVVVSSEDAARRLDEAFPGGRIRVLRFTTVPDASWTEGDQSETAAVHGIAGRYALLPNQLWVHKNHGVAFEAIRLLRDRGTDVTLVCTGPAVDGRHPGHVGKLREYVARHRLEQQVRILGAVPRREYVQFLRGAAAVVQPSRYEGWSSTVEDARALGKRLVVSDLPVHREQNPEGAIFFPAESAEALADALADALERPTVVPSEADALERQTDRVRAYARSFVAIAAEATGQSP
jgi:glycosyltransferase involved in cell wall biosynthesis